jgi:hypothetical protein
MPGDSRLPDTLSRPCDRNRRLRERRALGRVEAEIRADVRHSVRKHAAHQGEALRGSEHGLVGEIDDHVRCVPGNGRLNVGDERQAVVLSPAQLLVATDENGGGEVVRQFRESVSHNRGVVLAVDDRDSLHVRAVTSSSIAPVNFAYSSVSREKETSRSWPWNG